MCREKIYLLLLSEVKQQARIYKYYINRIIYSYMKLDNCHVSAWIENLINPLEEKGIFYKCVHVFFNSKNRKELLKSSCIIKPNKDSLHLVIKDFVNKNKIVLEIDSLKNINLYETVRNDYYNDIDNIRYINNFGWKEKTSNDNELIGFAKSNTDFNFKGHR